MFRGKWITSQEFANKKAINVFHKENMSLSDYVHDKNLENLHIVFKRKFDIGGFKSAQIKISADDYYKLFINGEFVCQGPTPGYPFAYYYNLQDITRYLKKGGNEIVVHTYYQGLINRVWVSGDMRQGLIADIIIDGKEYICTDEKWQYQKLNGYYTKRKIGYETQFLEDFDATIPDDQVQYAYINNNADYKFVEQPAPLVQTFFSEAQTISVSENKTSYDFGHEITACLYVKAKGNAGQKVRIFAGEELQENSANVRYEMRCGCNYDETLVLKEGITEHLQFDYKGFGYVQLQFDAGVEIIEFKAHERHFKFDDNLCTLTSSNKMLESVFSICKQGVKYGSQEVFVDCPTREKGQYAGDLTITSNAHVLLTGDLYLFRKAIENQMQSAFICKGLMAVAPCSLMQEIADYSLQFPLIALKYYEYSGDKKFLSEMLDCSNEMLKYFSQFEREDGLLCCAKEKWNLIDWPENLRDGYVMPENIGCHNVLNAFYIGAVKATEQIQQILGVGSPNKKSAKLIEAFNAAFFDAKSGLYIDNEQTTHSSLHSNVLPAFFEIMPQEAEQAIADFIISKQFSCGVYMAYFVLKALVNLNRHDEAVELIISETENSWGNMVKEGATTCFEAWGKDQKFNTSLCHPWASAPISVLIEDIMGIKPNITLEQMKSNCKLPKQIENIKITVPIGDNVITAVRSNGKLDYLEARRRL